MRNRSTGGDGGQQPLTIATFRRCAMFRGIQMDTPEESAAAAA